MPKVKLTPRKVSKMKCPMCPYRTETPDIMKTHLVSCGLQMIDRKPIKCTLCPFKTTKMVYLRRHTKMMHDEKVEAASQSLRSELNLSDSGSSDWDKDPDIDIAVDEPNSVSQMVDKEKSKSAKSDAFGDLEKPSNADTSNQIDLELGRIVRRQTKPVLPGRKRHEPIFPLVALGKSADLNRNSETQEEITKDFTPLLNNENLSTVNSLQILTSDASVQTDFPKHTKVTKTIVEYFKDNATVKEITEDSFDYY